MDIKAYIESGILELYVAGALSEKERKEVYELMQKHPEIMQEVLDIEAAVVKLTSSASPQSNENVLKQIKTVLKFDDKDTGKIIPIDKPKYNWVTYTGWAAALVVGTGLLWMFNQNSELENTVSNIESEKLYLEQQIEEARTDLTATQNLLNVLRDKDIITVPLAGQGNFATTYAKVYWDKKTNSIYLDGQGLPEAPAGKVYQIWSLTLNPLTPTSLGTIDDFNTDANKIFAINNPNESQAFGITLEPEGGSPSPTMEQLYTLGVVTTAP